MSITFGIKIILQDKLSPVAENTAIGLYNVANDNSEFRWIQNAIAGVTTWKEGMIVKGGIKPFSVEIDLKRGGNTSLPGRGSVTIKNTDKFWQIIDALGIVLIGLRTEIYVFNNSTPVKYRQYVCEKPTWDNKEYTIPFKGNQESRRVDITSQTNGVKIPATFGKLDYAKFVRTVDTYDKDTYTNAYFTDPSTNPEIKIFPVVVLTSPTQYRVELNGNADILRGGVPEDTYVIISSGNGEGQIRQVTLFEVLLIAGNDQIRFTIKDVLLTELSATNDDTRSWVQFVKIGRNYNVDSWPCKDFLKSADGTATATPELFSYADDKFNRISDFGFTVKDTNNNALDIDGSQYSDDIDNLESFIIKPITSLALVDSATLEDWKFGGTFDSSLWEKKVTGIYGDQDWTDKVVASGSLANAANAYDRLSTSYAEYSINFDVSNTSTRKLIKMLKFGLPTFPEDADVEKFYFGIKMTSVSDKASSYPGSDALGSILAMFRRFAYSLSGNNVFVSQYMASIEGGANNTVEDLPDNYFIDTVSTNSLAFYKTHAANIDPFYLNGYTLFEITGCTKEVYNTFLEGGIAFIRNAGSIGYHSDTTKIYELAIIFQLAVSSIKKEIYSPLAGRIFNNTFAGRKTESELISHPRDLLETICRLQKDDSSLAPTAGWGKSYAVAPQVNTQSFDNLNLVYSAAGQFEDGMTDDLKRSICKNFNLVNWQNNEGAECVGKLEAGTPAYTVTLDSVMDRTKIKIIDRDESDIYVEPYVNYDKNVGSGEYDSQLKVTNTSATNYAVSYVTGVTDTAKAQAIWQACHSLALNVHTINEPPSDLTDLEWANGADAERIATDYLLNWVTWQGKQEIEFPTHFNIAASWGEMTQVNVVFSHLTNNSLKRCLTEEIVIDPNPPYNVGVKAIIL